MHRSVDRLVGVSCTLSDVVWHLACVDSNPTFICEQYISVGKRKVVRLAIAESFVSGLLWRKKWLAVRLIFPESLVSGICLRKKRLAVRLVFLKNCVSECSVRVVVASKIIANRLIVQKYSNVEVTGDPLEAACGAGMFVV